MQILYKVVSWALIYGLVKDAVVFFREGKKVDWGQVLRAIGIMVVVVLFGALLPVWILLFGAYIALYAVFLAIRGTVKLLCTLWSRWVKGWFVWGWKVGKGVLVYILVGAACGVVFFLIVGGMGLALLGTAVGIGIVPVVVIGVIAALAIMGLVDTWRRRPR